MKFCKHLFTSGMKECGCNQCDFEVRCKEWQLEEKERERKRKNGV